MRKKNDKKRNLLNLLQEMQPELIKASKKSFQDNKKLQQSIHKKQLLYDKLFENLIKLRNEIDMQRLALTMNLKNEKELKKKLATINKKSADISRKRALIENEKSNMAAKIKSNYYNSISPSINKEATNG
jgi:hypothetical protein